MTYCCPLTVGPPQLFPSRWKNGFHWSHMKPEPTAHMHAFDIDIKQIRHAASKCRHIGYIFDVYRSWRLELLLLLELVYWSNVSNACLKHHVSLRLRVGGQRERNDPFPEGDSYWASAESFWHQLQCLTKNWECYMSLPQVQPGKSSRKPFCFFDITCCTFRSLWSPNWS